MSDKNDLSKNDNPFDELSYVLPTALTLKTRLAIMCSIIYGTGAGEIVHSVQEAMDVAVEIENLANKTSIKMKKENPVPIAAVERRKNRSTTTDKKEA